MPLNIDYRLRRLEDRHAQQTAQPWRVALLAQPDPCPDEATRERYGQALGAAHADHDYVIVLVPLRPLRGPRPGPHLHVAPPAPEDRKARQEENAR